MLFEAQGAACAKTDVEVERAGVLGSSRISVEEQSPQGGNGHFIQVTCGAQQSPTEGRRSAD